MRSVLLPKALAATLLSMPLAACLSTSVTNDVPACERLIPAGLLAPVDGVPLPLPARHDDGHEVAQPWQEAFLSQSVQLQKSNERPPAVDHIYRTCLIMHRDALARSRRGPIGRLLGR